MGSHEMKMHLVDMSSLSILLNLNQGYHKISLARLVLFLFSLFINKIYFRKEVFSSLCCRYIKRRNLSSLAN